MAIGRNLGCGGQSAKSGVGKEKSKSGAKQGMAALRALSCLVGRMGWQGVGGIGLKLRKVGGDGHNSRH